MFKLDFQKLCDILQKDSFIMILSLNKIIRENIFIPNKS
jgi:hypothetical protein